MVEGIRLVIVTTRLLDHQATRPQDAFTSGGLYFFGGKSKTAVRGYSRTAVLLSRIVQVGGIGTKSVICGTPN